MKEKVVAIFNKPENCEHCPCFYESEGVYSNQCQLGHYVYGKGDYYVDIHRDPAPIPDWCPLQPLTVIGPAPEVPPCP